MNVKDDKDINLLGLSLKAREVARHLRDDDNFDYMHPLVSEEMRKQVDRLQLFIRENVPVEKQEMMMGFISATISTCTRRAIMEIVRAVREVGADQAHKGARKKGDASRDLTREVAKTKRGRNGEALTVAQLVPHVQAKRKEKGLGLLKEKAAERTFRRHLEGYPY